jgi:hypothetical protein
MNPIKLISFVVLFLSSSVFADDREMIIELNDAVEGAKGMSFLPLNSMEEIKEKVSSQLQRVLSMPKDSADEVSVTRIFDTTWIKVTIDGKSYITDQNARQWLGTDMSELFLFDEVAKRVVVGNDNRESLIDYTNFVVKFSDIVPVFPETRNGGESVIVYAFVDPSCPRCREFHLTQMEKWRSYGVTWVYIPFLVNPDDKKSRELAVGTFCADSTSELKKRVNRVYLEGPKKSRSLIQGWNSCDVTKEQIINSILDSGIRHGLAGSPMFVTQSGDVYYGAPSLEIAVIKKLQENFK